MVNPEFIKYVRKVCSGNISERKSNPELIFKIGKTVFSENDGV